MWSRHSTFLREAFPRVIRQVCVDNVPRRRIEKKTDHERALDKAPGRRFCACIRTGWMTFNGSWNRKTESDNYSKSLCSLGQHLKILTPPNDHQLLFPIKCQPHAVPSTSIRQHEIGTLRLLRLRPSLTSSIDNSPRISQRLLLVFPTSPRNSASRRCTSRMRAFALGSPHSRY